MTGNEHNQNVIGNTVEVRFTSLNNKAVEGKVDTGATTSSLHATNVKVDQGSNRVSFVSEMLSPNTITMEMEGSQTVHSADHGGDNRPMIKLDIDVNGVNLPGVSFNLNDRSNMDSHILVGQNILKAGNFVIDVNKGEAEERPGSLPAQMPESVDKEERIIEAIRVLSEADISLSDLLRYLKTQAVISIKE
jgi:hypothetical protein